MTTRPLLAALPEDRLDYVLALPETVAERQRAEYAHAPNLVIATLDDASWQLSAETALPDGFDVVLLRHTLHRAVSPKAALNQVRRWLTAGACLIVAERHPDWSADFLAGLANDWWHEATVDEVPHSSLAPAAAWAAAAPRHRAKIDGPDPEMLQPSAPAWTTAGHA